MEEHGLSLFHLEQEGINVKLKKAPDMEAVREALGGLAMAPAVPAAAPPSPLFARSVRRACRTPAPAPFGTDSGIDP